MRFKKPTDFSDVYSTFDYVGANCYSIMYCSIREIAITSSPVVYVEISFSFPSQEAIKFRSHILLE